MCRPIDHAYWFLSGPLLDVSTSCPLTEMWEHVCLTLPSVTVSFLFPRNKTAPPESVERDACVRQQVVPQHWHKCYDTLLCKCQSHPIKWLSDAIAHKGIPPIKFSVCCQLCFLFFPLFQRHFIDKSLARTVHAPTVCSVTAETRELLQYHVSCCSGLMLVLWFSWVMSVLVIHLQAVLTTYTLAIFTTMSVCSLQCWLHFDYWLLYLLSSTHIILLSCGDEIHPCYSRATYSNRVSPRCLMID